MIKCIEQLKEEASRIFNNQVPNLKVKYKCREDKVVFILPDDLFIYISKDLDRVQIIHKGVYRELDDLKEETKGLLESLEFKKSLLMDISRKMLDKEVHRELIAYIHNNYLEAEEQYPDFHRIIFSTLDGLSPLTVKKTGEVNINYKFFEVSSLKNLIREIKILR